jgi:flagellar basal body rod protein FlgC
MPGITYATSMSASALNNQRIRMDICSSVL